MKRRHDIRFNSTKIELRKLKKISFFLLLLLTDFHLFGKSNEDEQIKATSIKFIKNTDIVQDIEIPLEKYSGNLPYKISPNYFCRLFQAENDGIYFVNDQKNELWYKPANGIWLLVINNVYIIKTFGGFHSHLPVKYVEKGKFLVSETIPDTYVSNNPPETFPEAKMRVLLIDCISGKIIDRAGAVIYNHNPYIFIPEQWIERYNLKKLIK